MHLTARTATPARLATVAAVAAVLAILATVAALPALGPADARAMGPLPACRYDDILTTPRGYGDWSITQVDTILRVPKGYVPPDLVSTAQAGVTGGGKVRAVLIDDLREMAEAAAAVGNAIGVESAYRSYATQQVLFDDWVALYGDEQTLELPARPGHSEHQLGLAIDLRTEPARPAGSKPFGSTPAGQWVTAHAWEYGFVQSYPNGASARTCYAAEPWHVRYVGRKVAGLIHASGLTSREYLWANFTTTVVPLGPQSSTLPAVSNAPAASSAPSMPSATASPVATASPTPVPSPSSGSGGTSPPVASSDPGAASPGSAGQSAVAGPMGLPIVLIILGLGLLALGSAGLLRRRRGQSGVGLG